MTEAGADLEAARVLENARIHHLACFHAQQAAEKALKAFLYAQGEPLVLGHSVQRLRDACERYDATFGEPRELYALDGYYIPPRYPNGVPADTTPSRAFGAAQAEAAIALAAAVVEAVARRVGATE